MGRCSAVASMCERGGCAQAPQRCWAAGAGRLLGPLPPPLALQAPHPLLPPLRMGKKGGVGQWAVKMCVQAWARARGRAVMAAAAGRGLGAPSWDARRRQAVAAPGWLPPEGAGVGTEHGACRKEAAGGCRDAMHRCMPALACSRGRRPAGCCSAAALMVRPTERPHAARTLTLARIFACPVERTNEKGAVRVGSAAWAPGPGTSSCYPQLTAIGAAAVTRGSDLVAARFQEVRSKPPGAERQPHLSLALLSLQQPVRLCRAPGRLRLTLSTAEPQPTPPNQRQRQRSGSGQQPPTLQSWQHERHRGCSGTGAGGAAAPGVTDTGAAGGCACLCCGLHGPPHPR